MRAEAELFHLFIGDLDACFVWRVDESGGDAESRLCTGRSEITEDGLKAFQGVTGPVLCTTDSENRRGPRRFAERQDGSQISNIEQGMSNRRSEDMFSLRHSAVPCSTFCGFSAHQNEPLPCSSG